MNNDGFTKLFSSIVTSSLWSEDDKTRILWITILAITDKDGFCGASLPGLAAMARLSIKDTEESVAKLEAPDQHSRSSNDEGRRLHKVEGGWLVINFAFYRDKERADKRREYMANLMREKRANDANNMLTGANPSASASSSSSASSPEGGTGGTWRDSFAVYQAEELAAYDALRQDESWQAGRQKYHPNLDILLSLEKAHVDFWGTEAGWAWKKKSRSARSLNWKSTFATSLSLKGNQVWKDRNVQAERSKSPNDYRTIMDACKRGMERIQGTANWQDRPELVAEYRELRNNKVAADKALAKMGGK